MTNLVKIGRTMFAIGLIAFGIQHFLYGDFITGRAPAWPAGVAGKMVWAGLSGLILIATGLSVMLEKKARQMTLLTALMILLWAVLRHIPVVLTDSIFGGVTTNAFKALTMLGGALVVAASLPEEDGFLTGRFSKSNMENKLIPAGRIFVGLFFMVAGVQHFIWADFVQALVPAWIPGKLFWTYFAGVALFAAGLGLLINVKSRLASLLSGLMILVWVLVLHIPRAIAGGNDANEWIAVIEAISFSGVCLALAGVLQRE